MDCPRCSTGLTERSLGGVTVHHCVACHGLAVAGNKFVPLAAALGKLAPPMDQVERPPDPGPIAACCACGGPVDHVGYLGQREVFIDRCLRCGTAWIDGPELEPLVVRYRASQEQRDAAFQRSEREAAERLATLHAQLVNQRIDSRLSSTMPGTWVLTLFD